MIKGMVLDIGKEIVIRLLRKGEEILIPNPFLQFVCTCGAVFESDEYFLVESAESNDIMTVGDDCPSCALFCVTEVEGD